MVMDKATAWPGIGKKSCRWTALNGKARASGASWWDKRLHKYLMQEARALQQKLGQQITIASHASAEQAGMPKRKAWNDRGAARLPAFHQFSPILRPSGDFDGDGHTGFETA